MSKQPRKIAIHQSNTGTVSRMPLLPSLVTLSLTADANGSFNDIDAATPYGPCELSADLALAGYRVTGEPLTETDALDGPGSRLYTFKMLAERRTHDEHLEVLADFMDSHGIRFMTVDNGIHGHDLLTAEFPDSPELEPSEFLATA